MPAVFIATA